MRSSCYRSKWLVRNVDYHIRPSPSSSYSYHVLPMWIIRKMLDTSQPTHKVRTTLLRRHFKVHTTSFWRQCVSWDWSLHYIITYIFLFVIALRNCVTTKFMTLILIFAWKSTLLPSFIIKNYLEREGHSDVLTITNFHDFMKINTRKNFIFLICVQGGAEKKNFKTIDSFVLNSLFFWITIVYQSNQNKTLCILTNRFFCFGGSWLMISSTSLSLFCIFSVLPGCTCAVSDLLSSWAPEQLRVTTSSWSPPPIASSQSNPSFLCPSFRTDLKDFRKSYDSIVQIIL